MVNNYVVPLNDFMQGYISQHSVCDTNSFGISPNSVTICVDAEEFYIYTEKGRDRYFKKDFARQLIESTVKSMLSPLK